MEKYMLKWQKDMRFVTSVDASVGASKIKNSHMYYLLTNMKMSIFELE
jgi:hypothetical protein